MQYVGEAGGMESDLAARAGIPFSGVTTGQIRGQAPWKVVRSLLRMRRGAQECAALIRAFQPDVVLITGGYVTVPLAWAASRARRSDGRRGIPLLIYLPDLTPGSAIRLLSRIAARVAVSFPEVAPYFGDKAVVTGYPVRPELYQADKQAARRALGLSPDLPVLLVTGGSRGARSINQATVAALPALLPRCQVLHISGQLDWPNVAGVRDGLPRHLQERYHPCPYLHEMVQGLAAADLVVARAGAATLAEFPAVRLPSILAPYPYAGQHQRANAAYLADRGAAVVLEDNQLAERLSQTVLQLLDKPDKLTGMSEAAAALARPKAADNIMQQLRSLAGN